MVGTMDLHRNLRLPIHVEEGFVTMGAYLQIGVIYRLEFT